MQPQELLDRCEYTIKYQMQEIDRLRAELERRDDELKQLIEWINGDADALATLQRTYMDPRPRLRETAGGELFSKPLKGQNCSLYAHGPRRWRYAHSLLRFY